MVVSRRGAPSRAPRGVSESPQPHRILVSDCVAGMAKLPAASVDLVFADPPYNLQLANDLKRPDDSRVDAVDDAWDKFASFSAYDDFTRRWLTACRRVMKPASTIWVIGSYHNIFRVGTIMQDLGFWILNDVIWRKSNPMPNFRGRRFTNAHETLIWAQRQQGAKYTFNHHAMKALNDDLQMRSDWVLPTATGRERIKSNGSKAHSAQKPEALLYRVILSSSQPGDMVLDPFFGTGTTGSVARRLHRHWIGIEINPHYVELARKRIAAVQQTEFDPPLFVSPSPRRQPRIAFGALLENGLLQAGEQLYFGASGQFSARVLSDGALEYNGERGSIHEIARMIRHGPCNGWDVWFYKDETGKKIAIDELREKLRSTTPLPFREN